MLATVTRHTAWLLLPFVLLLGGCFVEQDTISIGNDGLVSFESVVTVNDEEKNLNSADVEKVAAGVVDELQQAHWKVEQSWISKQRPFKIKFTGSGRLADVSSKTKFYSLVASGTKAFTISFLMPDTDKKARRNVVFQPKTSEGGAQLLDSQGKPVSKIDNVSPGDIYTIRFK